MFLVVVCGCMCTLTPLSVVNAQQNEEVSVTETIGDVEEGEISLLAVEEKWIQAKDGRWRYQHSDGSYAANGWEYIGAAWYYFDASGWMATGWLKLSGSWYYLGTNGARVTGWECVGGLWYYFNAKGVMQTGWKYISYKNAYGGNKYYNHFSSSGDFTTDSDVKGCSHGYSTFGDYRYTTSPKKIKYYSACSSAQNSKISVGASTWNNNGISYVSQTTNLREANMLFYNKKFKDPTVLAETGFYVNGVWAASVKNIDANWTKTRIYVDSDSGVVSSGTIAHEIGHAFGLSHRITNPDSIMCQVKYGRRVSSPQSIDIDVLKHIY